MNYVWNDKNPQNANMNGRGLNPNMGRYTRPWGYNGTHRFPQSEYCTHCKRPGHNVRNCFVLRTVKCFGCGQVGHLVRDCFRQNVNRFRNDGWAERNRNLGYPNVYQSNRGGHGEMNATSWSNRGRGMTVGNNQRNARPYNDVNVNANTLN